MIEYTKGNILESDCEALINPCNCVGVMGKGLALQYRKKWPEMYLNYRKHCNGKDRLRPGKMHVWKIPNENQHIVNFPTKGHYRNPSKMEYIEEGLKALVETLKEMEVKSVAIPPLGCGLGGLHWYLVKQLIQDAHDQHWQDIRVVVFEP